MPPEILCITLRSSEPWSLLKVNREENNKGILLRSHILGQQCCAGAECHVMGKFPLWKQNSFSFSLTQ